MSCHLVYMVQGRKMTLPVPSRESYLKLRHAPLQIATLQRVRQGSEREKMRLVQFNYSCLPGPDRQLRGVRTPSRSVGMDVDHIAPERMEVVKEHILMHRQQLGLLMLERSARAQGYHLVFRRRPELSQEENLRWASTLLGVEYDPGAKDLTRVFFATTADPAELLYLNDELFDNRPLESSAPATPAAPNPVAPQPTAAPSAETAAPPQQSPSSQQPASPPQPSPSSETYLGLSYAEIIAKWWELYNDGQPPVRSNRDVLTFELAVNLRHICGFDRALMDRVIPCYDGFPQEQKMKCIDSALAERRTQMPRRLRDVIAALKTDHADNPVLVENLEGVEQEEELYYYRNLPAAALPMGVSDSIEAAGPQLTMPVLAVVCPMVGALATGVEVLIHGKPTKLNLHSFIVGDAASGKGELDHIVEAWMAEEISRNADYFSQEEEQRNRKRAAKNAKQQPGELRLPVRFITMNTTLANLCDRLANTGGKHAFSFTPEADNVAQRWRSEMCNFSAMLRQAYDGSRYDREAKSAEAVVVHIDHLLWNVSMCGTPDALYRVINNYTDGLLSRFILARTPDNTFAPLCQKPRMMTPALRQRILQVAHLLPLMQGRLDLPALELRSRQWVEQVRCSALKDDDRIKARARLRDHVVAQRMVVCLLLCRVAEELIRRYGPEMAEQQLLTDDQLTARLAGDLLTPDLLNAYDLLADSLIDNDMYFFRERLEAAQTQQQACLSIRGNRVQSGKNDSVFSRLTDRFNFEQAMGAKGAGCTRNSVSQMLKNWRRQGLIRLLPDGQFAKNT